MHSWHDFHIVRYLVSGRDQRLTFDLEWPYQSLPAMPPSQLSFGGVECYYLEHDLGANIVYSFAESPLLPFLEQWQSRFETECKWGWPKFWRATPHPPRPVAEVMEEAFEYLSGKNIRCIELSSSYGLSGWVLAASVQEHRVEA